jgi:hypothetical protein
MVSSFERNSLADIGRRHFDYRRLRPLAALSHINVRLYARAARGASLYKPLFGGTEARGRTL